MPVMRTVVQDYINDCTAANADAPYPHSDMYRRPYQQPTHRSREYVEQLERPYAVRRRRDSVRRVEIPYVVGGRRKSVRFADEAHVQDCHSNVSSQTFAKYAPTVTISESAEVTSRRVWRQRLSNGSRKGGRDWRR